MPTLSPPPPDNDRLGSTLFVAALLHGVVILGVTFTVNTFDDTKVPALNVALVVDTGKATTVNQGLMQGVGGTLALRGKVANTGTIAARSAVLSAAVTAVRPPAFAIESSSGFVICGGTTIVWPCTDATNSPRALAASAAFFALSWSTAVSPWAAGALRPVKMCGSALAFFEAITSRSTSHFSSRIAAERSRRAQDLGADMVMLMPPLPKPLPSRTSKRLLLPESSRDSMTDNHSLRSPER